jgi:hypothetical protein
MAFSGQIAIQWPQAMHPNSGSSDRVAFPLMILNPKSEQTVTHFPHPLHFSWSMVTVAVSSVLLVGMDMGFRVKWVPLK